MRYWTPEVIIRGLDSQEGQPPNHTIENMLFNFEYQAREVLKKGGYGVHEDYLTPDNPEQDRLEWLHEAFHTLDYKLHFEEEQAAITLIEASKLQDYLTKKDANNTAVTMAKLVAIALLPSDTDMTARITEYKNRPRTAGQQPKQSKGIRAAYKELRNRHSELKAIGCWNKLLAMAKQETEIADEEGNTFILKIETYTSRSKDPEADGNQAERIFSENYATGKREGRTVTLKAIQR